MGFKIHHKHPHRRAPVSEINVTPFVDVMLVLLIIFMVAAPLMTAGVPVELPESAAQTIATQEEPLVITIDAKGDLYLQESRIERDKLAPRLQAIIGERVETPIYVRADKAIAYGAVMQAMGLINAAGFSKVTLVTETQ